MPSTASTKTPGVIATLMQEWEEEEVPRILLRVPFPLRVSLWTERLPLHFQTSPSPVDTHLEPSWQLRPGICQQICPKELAVAAFPIL